MRKIIILLFILLVVPVQADQRLSKAKISKMLKSIADAAQARDIEGMMQHFAPSAIITLETNGKKYPMSIDQYRAQTLQGWKQMPNSTLTIKNLKITVSPNGKKAQATDISVETADLNGRKIKAETHETTQIELIDGSPKITSLTGVMQMK